jgi:hypothetical protein
MLLLVVLGTDLVDVVSYNTLSPVIHWDHICTILFNPHITLQIELLFSFHRGEDGGPKKALVVAGGSPGASGDLCYAPPAISTRYWECQH